MLYMTVRKKLFSILILGAIFVFLILPTTSFAQSSLDKLKAVGGSAYGLGEAQPRGPVEIIGGIIKIGLNIVGLIFLILMIYGGFLWMTARGDEQKVTKSKELLEAAIIGLVIVFAAYGITYFVVDQISNNVITGAGVVE